MMSFSGKIKKIRWSLYINYIAIGLLALVFGVVSIAGGLRSSAVNILEQVAIAMILAVSLSLVVGFLGELSLGHAGFMCVGAYLGGKVSALLSPVMGDSIPNLLISLVVGGISAGVFGFIIGLPALRLKGDYLAIVTLAFGEIVKTVFQNSSSESFGGNLGLKTPRYDEGTLFIFAFLIVLGMLAVVQNLIRSKHGRAITSIRDSEIAARATGISVTKYKLIVFVISSFFAGIAGVLYSFSKYNVQSSKFGYNYSIEILVMVVLGGMGSINGALISAALITFLNNKLKSILTGDRAVYQNLFYALILIVIVIYNNAPALASFREKNNLKNIWAKITGRKKKGNDDHTSDAAEWSKIPTKIPMDEVLSVDLTVSDNGKSSSATKEETDGQNGGANE